MWERKGKGKGGETKRGVFIRVLESKTLEPGLSRVNCKPRMRSRRTGRRRGGGRVKRGDGAADEKRWIIAILEVEST